MTSAPLLARAIHGRAEATARLDSLVEGGGAVVLVGEAGIGKTRLARHAGEQAGTKRAFVLEGHATLGAIEPLGVICDLVRAARRAGISPPAREREAAAFPAMVLPELGGGSDGAGLGAIQDAAARYIRAIAGTRGALVVLEDLHWADATSLGVITYSIRAVREAPVAFVLTHRPADDPSATGHLAGVRAELARERLAQEITLTPLESADASAMLTEVLGGEPPPEVTQELLRLAEGNPFALEELARAAVESGWFDPHTGSREDVGPVALPWTLAESIVARAAALDAETREVLAWAVALGDRIDALLLREAAEMDELEAGVRLDALAEAGFLVALAADDGAINMAFRHALVLEALSREGGALRRRARHARILAAAESLAAQGRLRMPAAELARHALAAGDRARALVHSRSAADHALELGAVEEATVQAERALGLWTQSDGPRLRAELLFSLGSLLSDIRQQGPRPVELLRQATTLYEAAQDEAGVARSRAAALERLILTSDQPHAIENWRSTTAALQEVGADDALPRTLGILAIGLSANYRIDEAVAVIHEGLTLVPEPRTAREATDRTRLLMVDGLMALSRADAVTARDRLGEAAALAARHHDDMGAASALRCLAFGNIILVRPAESLDQLGRAAELVAAHGLRELEGFYLGMAAYVAAGAGAYERAADLLGRAEQLVEGTPGAGYMSWSIPDTRAALLLALGELGQAMAVRREMATWPVEVTYERLALETAEEVALLCLLTGEPDEAGQLVSPHVTQYLALIACGSGAEIETFLRKVIVLEAAGDRDDARTILEWARRLLPDHPHVAFGDALLAIRGDPGAAAPRIEEALAAWDAQGWRADAARLAIHAAQAAERAEEGRAAAVTLARGAHTRFQELGADAWCRRIEGMLRRWGERAPTRPGPGAGGLSQRELEVLALVAEGLTNHQIAQQLVISDHTAIRHVANLMAKLGAPNRAAAVTLATERGLLTG